MAKKIMHRFLESGESVLSNYNWADIADGSGYINFYPGCTVDDTGTGYLLFPVTIESATKQCSATTNSAEFNFDTTVFNLPRVVKGTAWLSMNYIQDSNANGTEWDIVLYKVAADTTETALNTTVQLSGAASVANQYCLFGMPLTQTIIKKGEKLRLSITLDPLANFTTYFGTDPTDAASTNMAAGTTLTKLAVPFRIDN
jgi:hypothetical protein